MTPSQLMNRRPSSSTTAIITNPISSSNQFLLNGQISNLNNVIKTASTSAINQPIKSTIDHLSSSTNHLTALDSMKTNYVGNELIKTASVTLTTNTPAMSKQFLDVNNNSNAYNNLRRKSSSALSNASNVRFNRTLSLRSSLTNETEDINLKNSNISNDQQSQQLRPNNMILNSNFHQPLQQTNSIGVQNQIQSYLNSTITRQPSVQMRSSPMIKSMNDVDKQTISYTTSSTSISSALATPLRRPSSSNQMQTRCISAMDTFRRRPLSISANSCSSSDELTDDTESLSKAGLSSKNEVDNSLRSGKIIGQIKLGIIMTKGLLEIEIIEAKLDSTKLQNPANPNSRPGMFFCFKTR